MVVPLWPPRAPAGGGVRSVCLSGTEHIAELSDLKERCGLCPCKQTDPVLTWLLCSLRGG